LSLNYEEAEPKNELGSVLKPVTTNITHFVPSTTDVTYQSMCIHYLSNYKQPVYG